jgi:putative transcriptional regulator
MEPSFINTLKGQFLIAMPGLADPNFFKTVTCISEHSSEGAMGIIINRIHPLLSAKDVFDELKIEYIAEIGDLPVYAGGPVHIGEIFILHTPPLQWEGSFEINEQLALSNTRDVLEAIGQGAGPQSFLLALGCAGWGQNQLEEEIKQNAWITSQASMRILYETPVAQRWEAALGNIGIDPTRLSENAGHA